MTMNLRFRSWMIMPLVFVSVGRLQAQRLAVYNTNEKQVTTYKQGMLLDCRVDSRLLYPDRKDSIVEARIFAEIDTIIGTSIKLVQTEVILQFTKQNTYVTEAEYEYTDLTIDVADIKGLNYTPLMQSVGNGLLTLGVVALLASPLLGLNPSGGPYVTERFALMAGIGGVSAIVGATFYFSFKQRPFQFRRFDGPEYFKRYQAGSLSIID